MVIGGLAAAAVLESEAFGPYKRPDYTTLLKKNNASVLGAGEAVQKTTRGSEAGIPQPPAGQLLPLQPLAREHYLPIGSLQACWQSLCSGA